MPHVLGLTLIRQMRADAALAGTPTIALMARALSGDRERCLRVGARGYLCKPVKFDELLGRCNRHFATATAARGDTGESVQLDATLSSSPPLPHARRFPRSRR